jgi:hypothetical protein
MTELGRSEHPRSNIPTQAKGRIEWATGPVQRELVARPEDWIWSSARHYATGEDCGVEIESRWTERRREQLGVYPVARRRDFM